jgi:chromate transporter
MIFVELFARFFHAGLFAVGGGLATLPFLYDMSDKTGWFSYSDLANMVAVSESTPGPMGINMASYVGFTTAGAAGSVTAVAGLVAPSVIVIMIVAGMLERFRESRAVMGAFYGLRPASCALIAAAGIGVVELSLVNMDAFRSTGALSSLFEWKYIAIAAAVLALTRWVPKVKKLHPIFFIAASAAAGVLIGAVG